MSTARFPVLLVESHSGLISAMLVTMPEHVAVDRTPQGALQQLRALLQWFDRHGPWHLMMTDGKAHELLRLSIEVTPQEVVSRRRFPDPWPMRVVVPCVVGGSNDEGWFCSVPTLDLWFSVPTPEEARQVAELHVRDTLRSQPASVLARHLGARDYRLDEIVLRAQGRDSPRGAATPELESVAEAIGERSVRRQFPRAWERNLSITELAVRVHRDRESVLLVGNAGVGKTSVLVSTAREIERTLEPEHKDDNAFTRRRFWLTSASRLIAGTPWLGQWERRLEQVIEQLANLDGVLCVENLLELVRVGGSDPGSSVGAFLVPYLKHAELRLIAEATPAELDACRRLLPSLADALNIQIIRDLTSDQSMIVLQRIAEFTARSQRIEFSNEAVQAVHRLYSRFRPYDVMPGQASRFMQTMARNAGSRQEVGAVTRIDEPDVVRQFELETGLPLVFLRDDSLLSRDDLLGRLQQRVRGQDAACESVANVVLTFKAGLNDPGRPVGSLLFTGPTGVGKTELARALAHELFGAGGGKDRLVRLDMSEYAGFGAADRMLSDNRGEPSDFIRRLRAQPFCVVLLDEIEKASSDVYDLMLAMLDEGRLTDRLGRVTSLQSAVIIMTSNLGAERTEALGFGTGRGPDYDAAVSRFFRPEFYNRLDAVIAFKPLEEATILEIAAKELAEFAEREGLRAQGIRLRWDDAVLAKIADAGYDRRFGARPLQRTLEQLVTTPVAKILAKQPTLANVEIVLSVEDNRIEARVIA